MLMRIVAAGSSKDDCTNDCAARWKIRSGRTELMSFSTAPASGTSQGGSVTRPLCASSAWAGPAGDLVAERRVVAALAEGTEILFVCHRVVVRREELVLWLRINTARLHDQDSAGEVRVGCVVVARDLIRRDKCRGSEADLDPVLGDEVRFSETFNDVARDDAIDVTGDQDAGLLVLVDLTVRHGDLDGRRRERRIAGEVPSFDRIPFLTAAARRLSNEVDRGVRDGAARAFE